MEVRTGFTLVRYDVGKYSYWSPVFPSSRHHHGRHRAQETIFHGNDSDPWTVRLIWYCWYEPLTPTATNIFYQVSFVSKLFFTFFFNFIWRHLIGSRELHVKLLYFLPSQLGVLKIFWYRRFVMIHSPYLSIILEILNLWWNLYYNMTTWSVLTSISEASRNNDYRTFLIMIIAFDTNIIYWWLGLKSIFVKSKSPIRKTNYQINLRSLPGSLQLSCSS